MNGTSIRHTLIIENPQGLHMRPITAFVETAVRFQSSVQVSKAGDTAVNGKSPINLLGLAAEQGTQLILEITGPDAEAALQALVEVLRKCPDELGNA
jgi:phosphotransferase system HPr (HPr) family protein